MASSAIRVNDKAVIIDLNLTSKETIDAKNLRISCSGTFLDYSKGYIITNGLILTPFLEEKYGDDYRRSNGENENWIKINQFLSNLNEKHVIECNNNESRCFLDFIESQCEITVYVQNENEGNRRLNYERKRYETNINPFVALAKAAKYKRRTKDDNDSSPSNYRTQTARLLAIWRCESLDRVFNTVLSQTNSFSFVDSATQSQDTASTIPETVITKHTEEQTRTLLPFFVLLKVAPIDDVPNERNVVSNDNHPIIDWFITSFVDSFDEKILSNCFDSIATASQKLIRYFSSRSFESRDVKPSTRDVAAPSINYEESLVRAELVKVLFEVCKDIPRATIGSKLRLISTPFGSLSPSVFLNSISEGIVTNIAGDDDTLIMTDARCVPGCEGGALYVQMESGLRDKLIGIVVAPFCWRQNEWVGLTFACSLRPLLMSLLESIIEPSTVIPSCLSDDGTDLSALSDNVALVKIGSRWGSAVVVDLGLSFFSKERILLTCCHVIRQQIGSKVRLTFTKRGTEDRFHVDAVVLYATPPGQIYDVAVLLIDNVTNLRYVPKGLQLSNKFVKEGDRVHVVGHGLFDDHVGLSASVTSGIISKVLYRNRKEVLIQSTCAVHPGVSGGALLNAKTNQLSGIIVCNARDAVSGACYPHINLSIPSTILEPVLQHFRKYRDPKIFQTLHDADPILSSYWQLGYNGLDKINSKL